MPVILVAFLIQAESGVEAAATGGSWKVVATPNVTTLNNALNGVSAISSSNTWEMLADYYSQGWCFVLLMEPLTQRRLR
jgi:hypothetical protein